MRELCRGTGFLLHVPGLMALLSLPVAWWANEPWGLVGLAWTAGISVFCGQCLLWLGRGAGVFQRYQSMQIAGISWLLIALLGTVPFLFSAALAPANTAMAAAVSVFEHPVMALFESVSGFTSTGLTVVGQAADLPAHIQWWRSFSEWVGGIGVILLLIAVLPAERGALNLYFSEAREEKILPTVKSTVRTIWLIYVGYTVASVGLLWLAGEPAWRALNHGMTAIATGGFSITNDSLMSTPAAVQLAYMPIMIAGAMSFLVHYRLIVERQSLGHLWRIDEWRLLIGMLVIGLGLLGLERWLALGSWGGMSTALTWVSALTTAGFASVDLASWGDGALLVVLAAVLMGGMAGSTSGGVKLLRVSLLFKDLLGQLRSLRASRHEKIMLKHDGERVSPERIADLGRIATRLVGVFMLLWLVGVFLVLHTLPADVRLAHVFFDTASALFNSGLSTGIAGPNMALSTAAILSLLMLLGRLEIFPLLVLGAWLLVRR